MVDRNQRLSCCHGQRLCGNQSDHYAADQTGSSGGSDGIDIVQRQSRISKSDLDQRRHHIGMRTRRDFRNNPAKGTVMILLPRKRMRQDRPVRPDDCRCGFVTA